MNITRTRAIALHKNQQGMMLLEGLLAILIFSLGVLAMVGLQAQSIAHTSQAKYRVDASFLANKLIGEIWADAPANRVNYATGAQKFNDWKSQEVDAYMPPGRTTATVTVTPLGTVAQWQTLGATIVTGHRVVIQIQWRTPNEPDTAPAHNYTTASDIIS